MTELDKFIVRLKEISGNNAELSLEQSQIPGPVRSKNGIIFRIFPSVWLWVRKEREWKP